MGRRLVISRSGRKLLCLKRVLYLWLHLQLLYIGDFDEACVLWRSRGCDWRGRSGQPFCCTSPGTRFLVEWPWLCRTWVQMQSGSPKDAGPACVELGNRSCQWKLKKVGGCVARAWALSRGGYCIFWNINWFKYIYKICNNFYYIKIISKIEWFLIL